mmetsp:Transcript_46132/g.142713  ORF Transcript_46132/g.142713 Transcript_46132/m.142713 type:complete len:277 (-) Transcript_46132:288-1118(-)
MAAATCVFSSCLSKGLLMKSLLPHSAALAGADGSPSVASKSTGRSSASSIRIWRMWLQSSTPDMSASTISKSTQSGSASPQFWRYLITAGPSMTVWTSYSGSRMRSITIWWMVSSMTERMRGGCRALRRTLMLPRVSSVELVAMFAAPEHSFWSKDGGVSDSEGKSLDSRAPPTAAGSRTPNVVPTPTSESTEMRPPWRVTTSLAIESPRPTPSNCRASELSSCSKGWKILSMASSGMPRPVSVTSTSTHLPPGSVRDHTVMLPLRVNLQAFVMML